MPRYSESVDYLVAAIMYLGTHTYYWARTPKHMASELSLDEARLSSVFEGFPGLFRRSAKRASNRQYFYSLQARYAQREGEGTVDPEQVSYIEPLSPERLELVLNFVLQMAEQETRERHNRTTNYVAVGAAIVSAATAIIVAVISL
jgi:hypothetical protein